MVIGYLLFNELKTLTNSGTINLQSIHYLSSIIFFQMREVYNQNRTEHLEHRNIGFIYFLSSFLWFDYGKCDVLSHQDSFVLYDGCLQVRQLYFCLENISSVEFIQFILNFYINLIAVLIFKMKMQDHFQFYHYSYVTRTLFKTNLLKLQI